MRLFLVIFSVVPFFSWSKPLSNACFELAMETRFGTLKPIRERQNQSEWGDRFWIDSERGTLLEWNGTEVVERSFRASRGTPSPVPQLKRYEVKTLQLDDGKQLLVSQDTDTKLHSFRVVTTKDSGAIEMGKPQKLALELSESVLRKQNAAVFLAHSKKLQDYLTQQNQSLKDELRSLSKWKNPGTKAPRFPELDHFVNKMSVDVRPDGETLSYLDYSGFLQARSKGATSNLAEQLDLVAREATTEEKARSEFEDFWRSATVHRDTRSIVQSYFAGMERFLKECVGDDQKADLAKSLQKTRTQFEITFPSRPGLTQKEPKVEEVPATPGSESISGH